MGKCKIKYKINAYIFSKRRINKCVASLCESLAEIKCLKRCKPSEKRYGSRGCCKKNKKN